MNEQTIKLIEQFAQKLGTTSEYLWGVLIMQAKVQAIESAVFSFMSVLYAVFYIRGFLNKNGIFYDSDGDITVSGIFCGIMAIVAFFLFLFCFSEMITAIFNPEYWALREILKAIK